MKPVYLTGMAVWSPGHVDFAAFARGSSDATVVDCASPWVPPPLLRGASRLTRMLGEVAACACADGGVDPKAAATVYASGYGEIETMVLLLETIFAGDGQLSPMRFKNSVHNAASGLGSIGTGNQGFSTAIAAGDRSVEAAFIEALAWLEERGGDVVISVADDRLPEPLARQCAREGLAVGLCLRAERPAEGAFAVLEDLRQDDGPMPARDRFGERALPAELASNPAAAALPLIECVAARRSERVPLAFGVVRPFSIAVRPDARTVTLGVVSPS